MIAALFCATGLFLPCAYAEQGDAEAQYNLGLCYSEGDGVQQDDLEAAKWFRQAAERNHAVAQHNLGICCAQGRGVEQDAAEAAKWYRRAAEQQLAQAQYNLGVCYDHGEGVGRNVAEAVRWYRQAAEQNYAEAQNNLGSCYLSGSGVEQNDAEAVKWFRRAAEQSMALAQASLGACYGTGRGVERNDLEAVKWFRQAAQQNCAPGQYNLAVCFRDGRGVKRDVVEAYKWLLLAGAQGNEGARSDMARLERELGPEQLAEGQRRAGEFEPVEIPSLKVQRGEGYSARPADRRANTASGEALAQKALSESSPAGNSGAEEDRAAAANWFCSPDNPKKLGEDRARNEVKASKWYLLDLRAKAQGGDAQAQNELGEACYAGKLGMVKNAVEAVKWFRLAAHQNHPGAQANLGVCYERGDGVAKYEVEAYKWDLLAAAQGDSKAKRNASMLELMLSQEQIAEGKRRAQDWLERRKQPSTNDRSEP